MINTHYKLIAIDLNKQDVNLNKRQINFIGKLEQNAPMSFIIEKTRRNNFKIFPKFCSHFIKNGKPQKYKPFGRI